VSRLALRALLVATPLGALALLPLIGHGPPRLPPFVPHAPNLALIAEAPLAVKLHLITIAGAIGVAGILFSGVKGSLLHRTLGWSWVVFMLATAVSALFIRPPPGMPSLVGFSPLHLFSALTLIQAPLGVWAARRHDVKRHASLMTGLAIGGLGVAGLFAFVPGRLMWQVWFG
jgi:uncharacterized membrane protein